MKNFQNKAKIIKVSKVIRLILFSGLVLWTIVIPFFTLQAVVTFPKGLYVQIGLIGMLVLSLMVNLRLFRFFDRLKNGHLFDAQTVSHLSAAGKWWIGLWLYEFLFYLMEHGVSQISSAWGGSNLFAGLTVVFAAWLLKEAQELQEEQALTV